jgi:6-phosphogluconolactonase
LSDRAHNLVIVEDDVALARAVAESFVAKAAAAIDTRGVFFVALAGGSTPKAAYALLAAEYREAIAWDGVRFFFGDERCVPPDDDESNYKMARTAMLEPLGIRDERVFRLRGEDDPPRAAREYAELLVRDVPATHGPPTFDLVMLGMGPDGHTASLFPGTDPLTDAASLVRAPFVEKFATYRLTLTPRVLNAARDVDVATAGLAKADALAAVLEGPYDPRAFPTQILDPSPGRLTWLIDRAAATKLTVKPA